MARPKIKAIRNISLSPNPSLGTQRLTMDITLSLVGLNHKQVGHMAANMILIASSVTAKDLLETSVVCQYLMCQPNKDKKKGIRHTCASLPTLGHSSAA